MTSLSEKIKATAAFLKEKGMTEPEFGLILGSGLGELASEIEMPLVQTMRIFQTGAARLLLATQGNQSMETWQGVKSWHCKAVSIFMKEILQTSLLSQCV